MTPHLLLGALPPQPVPHKRNASSWLKGLDEEGSATAKSGAADPRTDPVINHLGDQLVLVGTLGLQIRAVTHIRPAGWLRRADLAVTFLRSHRLWQLIFRAEPALCSSGDADCTDMCTPLW
jgi:hypothetical protein